MKILELLVLLLTIPAAMVLLPLLALRVLRWARTNRGDASMELATGLLPDWMSDGVDSWVSDSATSEGGHSEAGVDHHDSGGHSH